MTPRAAVRPTAAAALALALLAAAGSRLAAQQPKPAPQQPKPAPTASPTPAAKPAPAPQPPPVTPPAEPPTATAAAPPDPRTLILDRLRSLDAKPDTAGRDSTAADSLRTLSAPAAPGRQAPTPMGAVQIEQDSIMKALEQLKGFTPTLYASKSARFAADSGRLVLLADSAHKAKVVQADQSMTADSSLVYNQNTQIACGYGKPVLSGAGQSDPVESDQVCYDTQKRMGVAFGARTKFQEGATAWYVNGHQVYLTGNGRDEKLYGADSEFTDCDLAQPHYHFTAHRVKIIRNSLLVARDATLYFADVPVFWLPFMVQPMQQGRHSGLLMPQFDLNDIVRTNTGYKRHIRNLGFYWAINDHLGALTSLDWYSGNWTAINGAFDYSFRRQFLQGGLSFDRYWRSGGRKELTLSGRNSWQPDERTNVNASVNYASSSSFVLAQSFDPQELNRNIDSNVGVSRRFSFGNIDFSARRSQKLQSNRVTMTLPQVNLSLVPVSLFHRADGTALLTWQGSGNFSASQDNLGDPRYDARPSTRDRTGSLSSSLQFGKFSWSQSINYTGDGQLERPSFDMTTGAGNDTVIAALPGASKTTVAWSTGLSFQQRLIGTSSISPSLSISGQSARVDSISSCQNVYAPYTCGALQTGMVAAPVRYSFGVGTQVDLYGFWPGVGPFAKIRHKISPTFSYTYSPAPARPDSLQWAVFGGVAPGDTLVSPLTETNVLTIGLNQTFEAKYKEKPQPDSVKEKQAAEDSTAALEGEPRRLPQARKLLLLAIQTSAVAYNFAHWQDSIHHGRIGFQTASISNSIRSDLIPGLQFNITHSLFQDTNAKDPSSRGGPRKFSPFLTSASTNFELNDQSWLFRVLGLASKHKPKQDSTARDTTARGASSAAEQATSGLGLGLVPGSRSVRTAPAAQGNVGSWRASFSYSLSRSRPNVVPSAYSCNPIFGSCASTSTSQTLSGNFTYQPTPNWSVTWRTAYDFTRHQFSDHVLTLTRDLHDWTANFSFVKAQNGNFTFQFHVALKAEPDLKFDYRQEGGGNGLY